MPCYTGLMTIAISSFDEVSDDDLLRHVAHLARQERHVVSYATGGPSTVENIVLRCRSHNLRTRRRKNLRCFVRSASPGMSWKPPI